MLTETVRYFDKKDPANTAETLRIAVAAAREQGIRNLVLATTRGNTALLMADEIEHEGISVTVVSHAYGQKESGTNPMPEEVRAHLLEKGLRIVSAAHTLSGAERCLSGMFGGVYPVEIIAHTLRMFGQGTKVCVEICAMAADAGLIVSGEPVVAVGGTGGGADTALILRPEVSSKILKTKIDRILCKPIE